MSDNQDLREVFNDGFGDFGDDFGDDFEHDMDVFAKAELVTNDYDGKAYYKKKSLSKPNEIHSSVDVWNYLYGTEKGISLKLPYNAYYSEEGYDYFPVLGSDVPQDECKRAIIEAKKKLKK